ncbi:MAG: GNAT family N-acetyltransferase [Cellulosilyticum sp.]|nr:GNAT family N-acetyltransferase [Cellulosilyticum sp.]
MEIRLLNTQDDIMTQNNVMAVSHVYEESWKSAYKGLIPQDYLEQIPKGHWMQALKSGVWQSFIMLDGGKIIGTSAYCGSRDEKLKGYGEVVSIYLLPEYMGKGYGKKLFQAVINKLQEEGYKSIYLWVLEGNSRAIKFYEKFGFKANSAYLDDNIGGKVVREMQYVYHME